MSSATRTSLFPREKAIIGMIHVPALPGTPHHSMSMDRIMAHSVEEARLLTEGGVDALIIENMHDRPYLLRRVGPEIVAGMTAVGLALQEILDVPLGVQILAGANRQALAVAQAVGASFIRVEGFVFAHIADEGLMEGADAGRLLRYRRQIGAENIAIIADIKKKHSSHSITADTDIAETARAAAFFGADGLVVTGVATAEPTAVEDLQMVRKAVDLPLAIGSGLRPDNLEQYWSAADAFIVGSYVKEDGLWSNRIDPTRLQTLMKTVNRLRGAAQLGA